MKDAKKKREKQKKCVVETVFQRRNNMGDEEVRAFPPSACTFAPFAARFAPLTRPLDCIYSTPHAPLAALP
jgi:hypothetical protein